MLNKFFERFQPTRWEDPFFGSLLFMKAARGFTSYWEGEIIFKTFEDQISIEVFIDTSSERDRPSAEQREYFRWVEKEFESICHAIDERLRAEPWGHVTKRRFAEEFTVGGLRIPLCRQPNEEWEISFDSASDPEHLYTATLNGLIVTNIAMDG